MSPEFTKLKGGYTVPSAQTVVPGLNKYRAVLSEFMPLYSLRGRCMATYSGIGSSMSLCECSRQVLTCLLRAPGSPLHHTHEPCTHMHSHLRMTCSHLHACHKHMLSLCQMQDQLTSTPEHLTIKRNWSHMQVHILLTHVKLLFQ